MMTSIGPSVFAAESDRELFLRTTLVLATTYGVRLYERPSMLKADERGVVLLPDFRQDPQTGLKAGQAVLVDGGKVCPWRLKKASVDKQPDYDVTAPAPVLVIACFARVTFIRACKIEGLFCALAKIGDGDYRICQRRHLEDDSLGGIVSAGFKGSYKVDLFPVGCLQPTLAPCHPD